MSFRYLRDPLFLVCAAIYFVNRLLLKRHWGDGFVHDHLNDVICVPLFAPIAAWLGRALGARRHDMVPQPHELVVMVVAWSILFEVILPNDPYWSRWAHRDPDDILCYAAGAVVAQTLWNRWYRTPSPGGSLETEDDVMSIGAGS
jgi:hypothetical protein